MLGEISSSQLLLEWLVILFLVVFDRKKALIYTIIHFIVTASNITLYYQTSSVCLSINCQCLQAEWWICYTIIPGSLAGLNVVITWYKSNHSLQSSWPVCSLLASYWGNIVPWLLKTALKFTLRFYSLIPWRSGVRPPFQLSGFLFNSLLYDWFRTHIQAESSPRQLSAAYFASSHKSMQAFQRWTLELPPLISLFCILHSNGYFHYGSHARVLADK